MRRSRAGIWDGFDANGACPNALAFMALQRKLVARESSVALKDVNSAKLLAQSALKEYSDGLRPGLNTSLGIHLFRPHEFDDDDSNDLSLMTLAGWLLRRSVDWRYGSHELQIALREWPSGGSRRVKGPREYVELDNLIIVEGRKAAIEIETSGNLDNGYFTLRLALRNGQADFGLMIVPWSADAPGRADEGKAQGRLDREFDSSDKTKDGPIFRAAIVRKVDVFRSML